MYALMKHTEEGSFVAGLFGCSKSMKFFATKSSGYFVITLNCCMLNNFK